MFTDKLNIIEPRFLKSRESAHEVDGIVGNCKLPFAVFKKEGSVWSCPTCESTYRLEYEVVRGSMAGMNQSGNVWVQVG